ncbi:hypothetical protein ACHQM5_027278 [Ranunculus cassubicifolius]
MKMKLVSATMATLMKACKNYTPRVQSAAAAPAATLLTVTPTPNIGRWKSYGNPCTDTYYYLLSSLDYSSPDPEKDHHLSESLDFHLRRLLPRAWYQGLKNRY